METEKLYIVTGATGHIGSHVVKALVARGERVRILALPGDNLAALEDLEVAVVYGDVCDKRSLNDLFTSCGERLVVIHAAGIVSTASRASKAMERVNVEGTRNIVDMCEQHRTERLLYISSVHTIPEEGAMPYREIDTFDESKAFGPYARTKALATQIVLNAAKQKRLDAVVVQPSGVIGPGDYGNAYLTQLMMNYLSGWLRAGVKGGYDFVDVRDVAEGILLACDKGTCGQCYILSSGYMEVSEIFEQMQIASGGHTVRWMLPMWLAQAAALFAEGFCKIIGRPPLFTRYSLHVLKSRAYFSHEKATRELGYAPHPPAEAVRDGIHWLLTSGRIKA